MRAEPAVPVSSTVKNTDDDVRVLIVIMSTDGSSTWRFMDVAPDTVDYLKRAKCVNALDYIKVLIRCEDPDGLHALIKRSDQVNDEAAWEAEPQHIEDWLDKRTATDPIGGEPIIINYGINEANDLTFTRSRHFGSNGLAAIFVWNEDEEM